MTGRRQVTDRRAETTAQRWLVTQPSRAEMEVAYQRLGATRFTRAVELYDRQRVKDLEAERRASWSEPTLFGEDAQ